MSAENAGRIDPERGGNFVVSNGDPGGVRDEHLAPDAPGTTTDVSPAGMELMFQTQDDPAAFDEPVIPETAEHNEEPAREKQTSFKRPDADKKQILSSKRRSAGGGPSNQFREKFDNLMKRLEDRFQNERLILEEKHSRELEEAMGYFSLSSVEREAKQQELQISLLEDIGNMAQQLHELTGALGPIDDFENLTLPSDPKVLEEYSQRMHSLEEQFQREKFELERKHASEMEQALGSLKMTREQREYKQLELQDQLSAEIGDMAKQLEELNRAKEAYESKMGMLKQQLTKEDPSRSRAREDPQLRSISKRLSEVERERDAAQDELRRLKLALQVTHGDPSSLNQFASGGSARNPAVQQRKNPMEEGRLTPQERINISKLRGRIEQIERELKVAAQTPGGSEKMRSLRERMELIEKDLIAAEESTKEHFALENLRARMEKVERLLTEGERAAKDWEALEELRNKIGNVDNDLKAVEEAKKEFEALQALRSKMEAVESELRAAEQLASDRENVEDLRARLGQVERELGLADRAYDDRASVEKLLYRLAKAERSLEDARESTKFSERAYVPPVFHESDTPRVERDEEVDKILERLALAEKKLKAAKESAQLRNLNMESYDRSVPLSHSRYSARPPSAIPFDERQSKIRARLQEHFEENDANRRVKDIASSSKPNEVPVATNHRGLRSKFEEPPRSLGGRSNDRCFVQDVQMDRDTRPRAKVYEDNPLPTQTKSQDTLDADHLESKLGTDLHSAASRPLRRRRGEVPGQSIKPSKSMPYSVLGDDEDRYVADLEELRYQRALLSRKFTKKKFEDEEKKAEENTETGPKYSFKEQIRKEEKQRLREKMYPREKSPPKQRVQEYKSGGDPPESLKDDNTDPPSQVKELQERLRSMPKTTRDPSSQNRVRPSVDPPDRVQPATRKKRSPPGAPSDEASAPLLVKEPETFSNGEDSSTFTEEQPATVEPQVLSPSTIAPRPEGKQKVAAPSDATPKVIFPPEVAQNVVPPPPPSELMMPPTVAQAKQQLENESYEQLLSLQAPPPSPPTPPPLPPPQPQQPIIHQTTVVDGRAAAREREEKDRVLRWVVIVMLCVAIVLAVVIIVVVLLLRNNNNNNRTEVPAPTPSPFPIIDPTFSPAPTMTTAPNATNGTFAPTDEPFPPAWFDDCPALDDDRPLALNGQITTRSTVGAMYDGSVLPACGAIEEIGSDGVWYALIGSGETVTLHTCTLFYGTFDTQLVVYAPLDQTVGCRSGLVCVSSNDDFCGRQSSVTFYAMDNTLYLVYISGMATTSITASPTEGEFSLTAYSSPEGSCEGATGPLYVQPDDGQLPVILVGALMGGTFGIDPCHPDLVTRTGELWYSVNGTGTMVVASTCHAVSNFPARLAVYSGTCDNLNCITADDEDCGLGNEISWRAEEGELYYLLVYSPDYVPDVTFGISLREVD